MAIIGTGTGRGSVPAVFLHQNKTSKHKLTLCSQTAQNVLELLLHPEQIPLSEFIALPYPSCCIPYLSPLGLALILPQD